MRFLKEAPLSKQENIDVLEKELETSHAQLFSIQKHSNNEILGILLFHNFNPQENSLELGFRVNPENQQKGICSSAVEKAIQELFTQGNIDKVEGRHSSFNKGSF
jgi:RimJ/RimL family protein N-acetyltransferase